MLPAARLSERMMGIKIPPARAVVEGIAGAMSASAMLSPYASPRVLLPKARTKSCATRSPNPVFSKPWCAQGCKDVCVCVGVK